jgi:methylenetetrahydrofolate reductase (NADPH)
MGRTEQRKVCAKVERLVRDAHLEVIPLKGVEEALGVLPVGSTVSITCSPKFGVGRTLEHR